MKKVPEGLDAMHRSPYCGDPGALVSYLYNDGSPQELAAIATHVQSCDICTAELAALGDTRELISAWSPPQTELGFTLTPDALPIAAAPPLPAPSTVVPFAAPAQRAQSDAPATRSQADNMPWWRQATPVWMQAVAAAMVFAAGMAIGATRGAAPASTTTAANTGMAAAPVKAETVSRGELADLEQRLRAELVHLSPAPAQAAPVQTASRTDDEALMKRVRALLNESEEKQRGELALRTAQVLRDIEIQRKVDIATLQQNIGQIQGATGAELRRQRDLYDQLINRAGLIGK
jgi:hypothetical protein